MGFGTLAIMGGVGVAWAVVSQVLEGTGKGQLAKQGTLALELLLWGVVIALLAGDASEALGKIGGLAQQFGQLK